MQQPLTTQGLAIVVSPPQTFGEPLAAELKKQSAIITAARVSSSS